MLSYLNDLLGLAAKESPWPDAQRLPLYLRGNRKYTTLTVDDTELLVLYTEQSGFSLPAFQKQLKKLREYWPGSVVLCFERLSAYQRKALTAAAFVYCARKPDLSSLYGDCATGADDA